MQPTVASVVWPWREKEAAKSAPKPNASPWKAAVGQAAVMAAIGAGLFRWLGHRTMGIVAWALAGLVLFSGLFLPSLFAAIERFGQRLGKWVGAILTWGLLVPFYYLGFYPLHLALKLQGKDPLQRRLHAGEPTYWTPRKPVADAAQYRKQF